MLKALARRAAQLGLWLALALPGAAACSKGQAPVTAPVSAAGESSGPLRGWHYTVTIDEALSAADIAICFEGRPPQMLIPGTDKSRRWAGAFRDDQGKRLSRTRQGVDTHELPAGSCVTMTIDLDALAGDSGSGRTARRQGNSVLARSSAWLWRPDELPRGATATIRFVMPEGYDVSVPWPTRGDQPRGPAATYVLNKTAFRWLGYAAWGELKLMRWRNDTTQLEVVALDDEIACDDAGLHTWLDDATRTVAQLFDGEFPREHLQVVLVPVEGRGGSVYFGMAGRGGGAGVYVMLDRQAEGPELVGGWTTIHEMLHHGMPFISEPWMAEGWVTYYTELLRTRAGHRDESAGWKRLAEGFARGERGGRGMSLRTTSETMHKVFAYQRVYWGGAAVAFLTDVALRQDSGGEVTMDDAMVELRRCCGDASKRWAAADLLSHLDAWYGKPLFSEVAERHLAGASFPPAAEAMTNLGIVVDASGEVQLDDAHRGAAMRRAIMVSPRPTPPN